MDERMKEKVLDLLAEVCEDEVVKEDLDMDLVGSDLLDSLAFAEFLALIEEELDIVIPPSEYDRKVLNTPAAILEAVARLS